MIWGLPGPINPKENGSRRSWAEVVLISKSLTDFFPSSAYDEATPQMTSDCWAPIRRLWFPGWDLRSSVFMSLFSLSDRGVSAEPAECQPRRQLSRRTHSDTSQMIPLAVSSAFLGLPWHCHLCIYQQGREIVSQSKPRPCSGHLPTSPSRARCVSFLLVPPVPAELLLPMKFPDWARAWWVFYLPIATWDLVLIFLQHSFPSIFTERRMDQKWQLSLCGCWY